jgi:hypothetical protein
MIVPLACGVMERRYHTTPRGVQQAVCEALPLGCAAGMMRERAGGEEHRDGAQ